MDCLICNRAVWFLLGVLSDIIYKHRPPPGTYCINKRRHGDEILSRSVELCLKENKMNDLLVVEVRFCVLCVGQKSELP
jgi:hypothetical protein